MDDNVLLPMEPDNPELQKLFEKLEASERGAEIKEKILSQLKSFSEKMESVPEGERDQLKNKFKDAITQQKVKEAIPQDLTPLLLILVVLLVLAFFGYKLYKNLVDKERRREEKAKAKQGKKKK